MSQIGKEIRRFVVDPLEIPIEVPVRVPFKPDYIPDEEPAVPVKEPVNG